MKTSERGLQFIKQFETLQLKAYRDPVGVWTIGWGHTPSYPGQRITEEQAEALFRADIERFEKAVGEAVKVPITQDQFDALVSLAYNIGIRALARSTLVEKLNAGDVEGAAEEFKRWVYGRKGGRMEQLPGLVRRREAESRLFRGAL
jgi:lysozyme